MKITNQTAPTRRLLVQAVRIGVGLSSSLAPFMAQASCNPFPSPYSLSSVYTTSSDCSVSNGNTFNVESFGGSLTNTAGNTLTNSGSLTNDGYLENAASATFNNNSLLTNNNYALNGGSLSNQAGGTVTNNSYLTNSATGALDNSGSLSNSNNALLWNYGSLTNQSGGLITNNGKLYNNSANFNNQSSAIINNVGGLISSQQTTISNSGTINNDNGLIQVDNGGFSNTGNISSYNGGRLYIANQSTFNNSGTISNGSNYAGTLVNNSTFYGTGSVNLTDSGWFEVVHYNDNSTAEVAHSDNLVGGTLTGNWYVGGYGTGQASLTIGSGTPITEIGSGGFVEIWGDNAHFDQVLDSTSMKLNDLNGGLYLYATPLSSFANQAGHTLSIGNQGQLSVSGYGEFVNSGTIQNAGSIDNHGFSLFRNTGEVDIGGSFQNRNFSAFLNESTSNLTIQSGGTVSNDASSYMVIEGNANNQAGGTLDNSGTLTIESGGHLSNDGLLSHSGQFSLDQASQVTGTGSFTQSAGASVIDGSFTQASMDIQGGDLSGTGTITLSNGLTVETGATLTPGNLLTLNGDLHLLGALVENINGTNPNEFGILNIVGAIDFVTGSAISFNLAGFSQVPNQHWDFLYASNYIDYSNVTFNVTGKDADLYYRVTEFSTVGGYGLRFSLVPEPGSLALLAIGGGLLARSRMKTAAQRGLEKSE